MSNKRTGWEICQEIINAQDLINAQAINKTNMTYKVKKRTGWEIFLKLINAQCLISSHRTDFFLKKNKRTCATIRQVRVHVPTWNFSGDKRSEAVAPRSYYGATLILCVQFTLGQNFF